MGRRIFFVAGEPSAFSHSALLIGALRQIEPSLEVFCWGDKQMEQAGAILLQDTSALTAVGVTEVVLRLPNYIRALWRLQADVERIKPDVVVVVDFPGFNLRAARMLKQRGYRIIYYIVPQVWAWGRWRLKSLKKYTDRLLCILPFEPAFFARYGVTHAVYVGNPVVEKISTFKPDSTFRDRLGVPGNTPVLALLPGSRISEVRRLLPVLLNSTEAFGSEFFWVVCAHPVVYKEALRMTVASKKKNLIVIKGGTYEALSCCAAAVVASGTATLEAALLGAPQVVVYRVSWLTYLIGRMMIRTPFLSLVNNIAGEPVVPELVQHHCIPEKVSKKLEELLSAGECQQRIQEGYAKVREALGTIPASIHASREILGILH